MKKQVIVAVLCAALTGMAMAETVPVFTGNNSYVSIGTPEALQIPSNEPFTIEGWMLFKSLKTRDILYCKSNARNSNGPYSYVVGFADNKLGVYNTVWRGNFAVTRQLNRWYHVAFSFDGTNMTFYLDGVLLGSVAFSYTHNATHTAKIGGYHTTSDINGSLSDVRVWNYARTQTEIQILMNSRLNGAEYGLLGYWPLNEGEGTLISDRTIHGSDGEMVGASWSSDDTLTLVAAPDDFVVASPFTLSNFDTGSTKFTNTNGVNLAHFPVPGDCDIYQFGLTGEPLEIDAAGWVPVDSRPGVLSFPMPTEETNLVAYVWFSNSVDSVVLRRSTGMIRYTMVAPVMAVDDMYLCELDETGTEAILQPADVDRGTAGGVSGTQAIPLHGLSLVLVGGPSVDLTPAEAYITMSAVGDYQAVLVAQNEAGNVATSQVFTVTVAPWAGPKTTSDVVWSGDGAEPYWNIAANWVGGEAPANPTPGTVSFTAAAHNMTSKLEADRMARQVVAGVKGATVTHTIDLGGHTLTVTNLLRSGSIDQAQVATLIFTNGTVRLGTANAAATLDARRGSVNFNRTGTWLDSRNVAAISLFDNGWAGVPLDMRNVRLVGDLLRVTKLEIPGRDSSVYCNSSIVGTTLHVTDILELLPLLGTAYIGDPDNVLVLGGGNIGKFPAGVNIILGVNEANRATALIGRASSHGVVRCALAVAGGGGTFTAYLSQLHLGYNEANAYAVYGVLDASTMESCLFDVTSLRLGTDRPVPLPTDNVNATLRLPVGAAFIGEALFGGSGVGQALLGVSNTLTTVSGSITLNPTALVEIKVGADSKGLDVFGDFVDAGGSVAVTFLEESPAAATNWALRVAGNAVTKLGTMYGSGRLTVSGLTQGKKGGVIYDASSDTTLFAQVDEEVPLALMAIAHNEVVFEKMPGCDVLVAASEIDSGSYDPDGKPLTISISVAGGPYATQLSFVSVGDYTVTLKVATENTTATDTCRLRIVEPHEGVNGDLTWSGNASTALMERPEWLWSGNWHQGVPPANPAAGTISFMFPGQEETGVLERDREVYRIDVGEKGKNISHTIDLNGQTLTIADRLYLRDNATVYFTLTNGAVCLGGAGAATLSMLGQGCLTIAPRTRLDCANLSEIHLAGTEWASAPILDLRGAEIVGGILGVDKLRMPSTSWYGARFYLDNTTVIETLAVAEKLEIGNGNLNANVPQYIGDPDDSFKWGSHTLGKLPYGLNLRIGAGTQQRAAMTIAESNYSGANSKTIAALRASGGGTFTAYLSTLKIGVRSVATSAITVWGMLHLAAMESCLVDADTVVIAPGRAEALPADNECGELWLPPGTATFGTVTLGAADGVGTAVLWGSNTTVNVTNSAAFNKTARVTLAVGAEAGGLLLERAAADALTVAEGALLKLNFTAPAAARPHYALRWPGNHVTTLNSWLDNGTVVIDDIGLGRKATVFASGAATYIGLPPLGSTVLMVR